MIYTVGSELFLSVGLARVRGSNNKDGIRVWGYEDTLDGRKAVGYVLQAPSMAERLSIMDKIGVSALAFSYYGDLPLKGVNLEFIDRKVNCAIPRTLRSASKMYPLLKYCLPACDINPIQVADGIVYDEPFLYMNGSVVCMWKPSSGFAGGKFELDGNFIVYRVVKKCYILEEFSKRHKPVEMEEALVLNPATGVVTCRYKTIRDNCYYELFFVFDSQQFIWRETDRRVTRINGFKSETGIK